MRFIRAEKKIAVAVVVKIHIGGGAVGIAGAFNGDQLGGIGRDVGEHPVEIQINLTAGDAAPFDIVDVRPAVAVNVCHRAPPAVIRNDRNAQGGPVRNFKKRNVQILGLQNLQEPYK
ncbi:MAG: hypothetical protein BWY83_02176 [bacterium ADurb.Bin478]|nr:MAG: hypothetical protein BWY83_02176 [bacterium ADurb.Bin478]